MRESRGVMTTLSKILCGLIFIFMCFSFRYSLHGGNPQSSLDLFVSAAKRVLEHDDAMKNMIGGRKLMMASEKKEEVTRMKRGNRETEREASKSVDEDGLVAYTADYWRAKHHPPKNN